MNETVTPLTAVQDFRNKNLAQLEQGVAGAAASPKPTFASPGLPTSGGAGLQYEARTMDTAAQASSAHDQLMSMIHKRNEMARAAQGRGTGGGAITGVGMTAGGGAGGAYGLQKNAAGALAQLQGAYQARWGQPLAVNSGGRTFAEQTALYNSYLAGTGNLAAKPGTSVHESGLAVDFGGAAHGFGPQQSWLQQVAGQYGFSWTGKNFSQVEPWHFEYVGS